MQAGAVVSRRHGRIRPITPQKGVLFQTWNGLDQEHNGRHDPPNLQPLHSMTPVADWMNRTPALARLGALPRPVLLALGAAALAILVVLALWLREPEYRALFSNVESRDGGAIVSVLNQRNIPFRFADNGATIMVPADQVYALRLELASQGLPRGGNVGFELLNETRFGASQFSEQITYQRALEGELARSIEALQTVKSARVHLAIPRQSLFVRDREAPTASVLLTLFPGRSLNESQVAAVSWLVSSSVPQLNAANVSIVDQDGHLLSAQGGQAGLESARRGLVNDIERRTTQRILTLLTPLVGAGNVRAQVSATIDFALREQTSETYHPNEAPGSAAIRSRQTSDSVQRDRPTAQGVPGALSNEPPANATAPIQAATGTASQAGNAATPALAAPQAPGTMGGNATANPPGTPPASMRSDATVNYEVDRTIDHVKHEVGTLQRLSAAVVVNYREKDGQAVPLGDGEMTNIDALVRQAMGFSAERGDTLSVVNNEFTREEPELRPWEDPFYRDLALQAVKMIGALILLFLVWRSVLRPLLQGFTHAQAERARSDTHHENVRAQHRQEEARASETDRHEENLATARNLAASDPRAVAMVLRSWMNPKNAKP